MAFSGFGWILERPRPPSSANLADGSGTFITCVKISLRITLALNWQRAVVETGCLACTLLNLETPAKKII